jgi:hypothetical protein
METKANPELQRRGEGKELVLYEVLDVGGIIIF